MKQTKITKLVGIIGMLSILGSQFAFSNCTSGTTGQGTLTIHKCDTSGCTMFVGPKADLIATCNSWYCCPGETTAYYYPSSCSTWSTHMGEGGIVCCDGTGTGVYQYAACPAPAQTPVQ